MHSRDPSSPDDPTRVLSFDEWTPNGADAPPTEDENTTATWLRSTALGIPVQKPAPFRQAPSHDVSTTWDDAEQATRQLSAEAAASTLGQLSAAPTSAPSMDWDEDDSTTHTWSHQQLLMGLRSAAASHEHDEVAARVQGPFSPAAAALQAQPSTKAATRHPSVGAPSGAAPRSAQAAAPPRPSSGVAPRPRVATQQGAAPSARPQSRVRLPAIRSARPASAEAASPDADAPSPAPPVTSQSARPASRQLPVQQLPAARRPPSPTLPPARTAPSQTLPPARIAPPQTLPPARTAPSPTLPPARTAPSQTLPPARIAPSQMPPQAAGSESQFEAQLEQPQPRTVSGFAPAQTSASLQAGIDPSWEAESEFESPAFATQAPSQILPPPRELPQYTSSAQGPQLHAAAPLLLEPSLHADDLEFTQLRSSGSRRWQLWLVIAFVVGCSASVYVASYLPLRSRLESELARSQASAEQHSRSMEALRVQFERERAELTQQLTAAHAAAAAAAAAAAEPAANPRVRKHALVDDANDDSTPGANPSKHASSEHAGAYTGGKSRSHSGADAEPSDAAAEPSAPVKPRRQNAGAGESVGADPLDGM